MNYSELLGLITGLSIWLIVLILLLVIPFLVFVIIANWKIFEKNGEEGWKSIIPFYNSYIYTKIAGLNWWYFLIIIFASILENSDSSSTAFLGSISEMFVYFLIFYNLAKKAGKDSTKIGILGALFTPIMQLIMGFSNEYKFDNNVELSPNGAFGEPKQNNEPEKYCLGCGKKIKSDSKFCEHCGKPIE